MKHILSFINENITLFSGIILIAGIVLLYFKYFREFGIYLSCAWKAEDEEKVKSEAPERKFDKELRLLIAAVGVGTSVKMFKLISLGLMLIVEIIVTLQSSVLPGIMLALIALVTPYVLLRLKLYSTRNKGSEEAERLVQSVLLNYRATNFNMPAALDSVIENTDGIPVTRNHIFRLAMQIKTASSDSEIRDAVDIFSYAIGTSWAAMLANNFYRAFSDGSNVNESLEDIMSQLKDARLLAEETKRLNAESSRMLFLIPVTYFGLIGLASKVGVSGKEFLKNQFTTGMGLLLFFGILAFSALSVWLILATRGRKFDF